MLRGRNTNQFRSLSIKAAQCRFFFALRQQEYAIEIEIPDTVVNSCIEFIGDMAYAKWWCRFVA
ncbi:hypothetical protein AB3X94_24735 [Paraburkholderia sp. BR10923]|uniref:hypothetical protein n=1 Tax=Paraburkholderia sp. BR10923 TaxID=3236992 RepID=UPI0034CF7D31